MPSFIKSPHDEKKWNAIKHSVAKQRGKSVADFTDSDWATVNAAWHKCEGSMEKAEELIKAMGIPSVSVPNPGKVGATNVRMPKAKSMPKATDKPSVFFKTEQQPFDGIKHPTLVKLADFMQKKHKGNKIK
jgi:hypothetical protein